MKTPPRTRAAALLLAVALILAMIPATLAANTDVTSKFTDPVFLEAVREILGKPAGPIYAEDCAKVEKMDISDRGIMSANGIEYFTGLEELDFSRTYISQINLSNCPALRILANGQSWLFTLDVSKNVRLESLSCGGSLLTTLDVSKNTALKSLVCTSAYLTKIDLSKNTKLEYLDLRNCYFPNAASIIMPKVSHKISTRIRGIWDPDPAWSFYEGDYKQGPLPSIPSTWATSEIAKAWRIGSPKLLPDSFQEDYQAPTTRLEFCKVVMEMMGAFGYVSPYYDTLETKFFEDVHDAKYAVGDAAALGIITGTSENTFTPDRLITRQEAAVLLTQAMDALHLTYPDTPVPWTDTKDMFAWAVDKTSVVYNLGFMGGTNTSKLVFSPKMYYSHEQTVITVLRLYEYALANGGYLWETE